MCFQVALERVKCIGCADRVRKGIPNCWCSCSPNAVQGGAPVETVTILVLSKRDRTPLVSHIVEVTENTEPDAVGCYRLSVALK